MRFNSFLAVESPCSAAAWYHFTARLTFAGMDKIGVAKRLPIGDDYEVTVQDDLLAAQSGRQILLLEIISEGHVTEP